MASKMTLSLAKFPFLSFSMGNFDCIYELLVSLELIHSTSSEVRVAKSEEEETELKQIKKDQGQLRRIREIRVKGYIGIKISIDKKDQGQLRIIKEIRVKEYIGMKIRIDKEGLRIVKNNKRKKS